MISAGLAALTTPAVMDCLATLGITMTTFSEKGYALSDAPISWRGYDHFLKDDFVQGLGRRHRNEGMHGSVFYDERGWPFPISAGLPDRTRSILGPSTAWPHLTVMRNPLREESVEWLPSISSLGREEVGSIGVAWHHAAFFSAWLGWKVQAQTGARVYFRLPTWAERGYPLRKRLDLSLDAQLVESLGDRTPDRDVLGPQLDRWPLEHEWLIDGQTSSGAELIPGYRLIFSASELTHDGSHGIEASASQSQVWEDHGTFRVAVGRDPLPPLAAIP